MYCIHCGVKLADTEAQCPLCQTRVFHPDLPRPEAEELYPRQQYPAANRHSLLPQAIVSFLLFLPMFIALLCDLQLSGSVSWSGYVIGALLVSYVSIVLPAWFQRPNPVIFVPCAFAAVACYLLYINLATGGGWFLSFAFPLTGGVGLIVTAVVTLVRYLRRGKLYIFGGAFIAMGGLMLLTEFLLNYTFRIPKFIGWSLYPLVTLVLLGAFLIFLAICRPARQTMERKLFI